MRKQNSRNTHEQEQHPTLGPDASSLARRALIEAGEEGIGDYVGAQRIDDVAMVHRFDAEVPGYRGWEWHVVLAAAPGSSEATISEIALVPADSGGALTAPDFVPFSQRLRPGDLKPGDLLPPAPDDPRLTEGSSGRYRLSKKGLREVLQRWRNGSYGPTGEYAEKATLKCHTCAFFLPVTGAMGEGFGVCANEYAADGHLVHASHGCGAHSETPPDTIAGPNQANQPNQAN